MGVTYIAQDFLHTNSADENEVQPNWATPLFMEDKLMPNRYFFSTHCHCYFKVQHIIYRDKARQMNICHK